MLVGELKQGIFPKLCVVDARVSRGTGNSIGWGLKAGGNSTLGGW